MHLTAQISIHAPAKGATLTAWWTGSQTIFQSTLPRRERQKKMRLTSWETDFNPRSREGSDRVTALESAPKVTISIHAPAKGATAKAVNDINNSTISIHAPAKGATRQDNRCELHQVYFNPRSREGSDQVFIHLEMLCTYFNPRSREGSDSIY